MHLLCTSQCSPGLLYNLLYCQSTLLAHVYLTVLQNPQGLLSRATPMAASLQSVLLPGTPPSQVQDLVSVLYWILQGSCRSTAPSCLLDSSPALVCIDKFPQSGITSNPHEFLTPMHGPLPTFCWSQTKGNKLCARQICSSGPITIRIDTS